MTNIEPLGSLILVQEIEEQEKKTKSGLVLTAASLDTELKRGIVIAVGPGDHDNLGNLHAIPLEHGDIVIYKEMQATEVKDGIDSKYFFINWRNLLGKEGKI